MSNKDIWPGYTLVFLVFNLLGWWFKGKPFISWWWFILIFGAEILLGVIMIKLMELSIKAKEK